MPNDGRAAMDVAFSISTVDVSSRGRWVEAPALKLDGQTVVANGDWIKIASLYDEDWIAEALRDPKLCVRLLKEKSGILKADILRFSQMVPDITPHFEYPMELRSIAVAEVGNFKSWWESLPQESRKNVRRSAKRGVTIQVKEFGAEVIAGIAGVQNETPYRQGRKYPHFGKSLEQVARDHGSFLDRSDFICAYCENEIVGFLKLVYRGNVAALLQLNSKVAHYDKRPANALLAKAVELCEARGVTHLTYGLFNYGGKGHSPLREFKERNGFSEMLVPNYYVPLSSWGNLCVKLKLYRGVRELLPKKMVETAFNLRAKWYTSRTNKAGVA
jgi:hypothetical protein